MAEKTLTSANSVYTLIVPGLFPSPVTLQGFAADRAFETDAVDLAEVSMGVDGKLSAGYTPNPTPQTITLQADSVSRDIFTAIIEATLTAREVYFLQASIVLPGTGEVYTMTRGVLQNVSRMPSAQKVLQPVSFRIMWESARRSLL